MRMRPLSIFGGIAAGMLIFLGSFGAALAQDEPQGDESQAAANTQEYSTQDDQTPPQEDQAPADSDEAGNPPGRAAQLSYAEGSVSLEPAGTGSWTSAVLNRPLTLGDTQLAVSDSGLTSRSDHPSSVTQVPRRSLCGMQAPCGHSLADSDRPIVWMSSGRATLRTPWGVDRHDERRCRQ